MNGEGPGIDASADGGNDQADMSGAEQQSEQTGKLDTNGKLAISVPTKFDASNKRHEDQDHTIEAGVTDAANREITGRLTLPCHLRQLPHSCRTGELFSAHGRVGHIPRYRC